MRSLALDTNAYTALGRGNQTLSTLVANSIQIGLPVTVLGEIHYGMLNGNQQEKNSLLLERFLSTSRVELLAITDATARLYGEIATELRRLGKPIQQNDIWIAALCKQYNYRLATNDAGFRAITGLEIISFS